MIFQIFCYILACIAKCHFILQPLHTNTCISCNYEYNVPSQLSPNWLSGSSCTLAHQGASAKNLNTLKYLQNLKYNVKKVCIFHLILVGILSILIVSIKEQGVEGGLLNRQNLLSKINSPLYSFTGLWFHEAVHHVPNCKSFEVIYIMPIELL